MLQLKTVNLSGSKAITDLAVAALSEALSYSPALQDLDLSWCELTDASSEVVDGKLRVSTSRSSQEPRRAGAPQEPRRPNHGTGQGPGRPRQPNRSKIEPDARAAAVDGRGAAWRPQASRETSTRARSRSTPTRPRATSGRSAAPRS